MITAFEKKYRYIDPRYNNRDENDKRFCRDCAHFELYNSGGIAEDQKILHNTCSEVKKMMPTTHYLMYILDMSYVSKDAVCKLWEKKGEEK